MDRSEIERLIDEKIAEHEVRFSVLGAITVAFVIALFLVLK